MEYAEPFPDALQNFSVLDRVTEIVDLKAVDHGNDKMIAVCELKIL